MAASDQDPYTIPLHGGAPAWQEWWGERALSVEPVLSAAAEQGFVLHQNELAGLGVSRQRARTAVRRGRWQSPRRGVIAPVTVTDADRFVVEQRRHALSATAELLVRRDHVVSGASAAVLLGLPTFKRPTRPTLTAVIPSGLGRRGSAHIRGAEMFAEDLDYWFGARVTTAARTVIDLARLSRRDGIVAADAALHDGLVSPAELLTALEIHRGWPGVRQAREIVALADGDAESPLESITRLALHDDKFPAPKLQAVIAGFRVDMLWPERRLVVECDGRVKYGNDESWWSEKRREQVIRRLDFRVERVVWSDIVTDWSATSARLRAVMRLPA